MELCKIHYSAIQPSKTNGPILTKLGGSGIDVPLVLTAIKHRTHTHTPESEPPTSPFLHVCNSLHWQSVCSTSINGV